MKKLIWMVALLLITAFVFTGCGSQEAEEPVVPDTPEREAVTLNVFAAASLTDALGEVAAAYANECGDTLQFNFGGSGALQKQIEEGAPCDLFASAAVSNMDALEEGGLIDGATRVDLLGNTLTLIACTEKKDAVSLDALTDSAVGSIALGELDTVPAGKYAKQSLDSQGLWEAVASKVVYAKDVRAVLQYVETGNADCGIVYRTDALTMASGEIIGDLPAESHDAILYPAAITAESANAEAAAEFMTFLQSGAAKVIFEKYGFKVME